jgi:hypothetical protein
MKKLTSVAKIRDPYTKRILSNILGKDVMKVYAATPARLRSLTRGLAAKQISTPPATGRWSIAFIISHLYDAECAMGYRIRKVIAEPGSHLQAYDENKWANSLHYDEADWNEKLECFTVLRRSHVSLLRQLSHAEWQRYGFHEERGKETVERMVQMVAGHDSNHVKQVAGIRRSLRKR